MTAPNDKREVERTLAENAEFEAALAEPTSMTQDAIERVRAFVDAAYRTERISYAPGIALEMADLRTILTALDGDEVVERVAKAFKPYTDSPWREMNDNAIVKLTLGEIRAILAMRSAALKAA